MIPLHAFEPVRLSPAVQVRDFTCGDDESAKDLNDFLRNDALASSDQLLTVTNLFMKDNSVAAFYSVLNDKITHGDFKDNDRLMKRFLKKRNVPHEKRGYKSFPAVKLARLGVHQKYKRHKLGTQILDGIKASFSSSSNKTGCRFITVDAYNDTHVLKFYQENGFAFLPVDEESTGQKTRVMYFDLKPYRDAMCSINIGAVTK